MNRKAYEKTKDYTKSVQLLREFVDEVLEGNIDVLRTFCLKDLSKYIGDINDPDMYLIVQAIYIILWGDIYDLTFDKMGSWDWRGTYAFRGDTINSFGSIFGKEGKDRQFAFRAKYFGADKVPELWNKIEEFYQMYHYIGNFIVLPNRGSVQNGINGARAGYYDTDYCEGMRDYFDWFLVAVAKYQEKVKRGDIQLNKFEMQLQRNPEYNPFFLDISEWEKRFFLEDYYENGIPKLLFKTPIERRLLKTTVAEERQGEEFYEDEEYLSLMEDFLDKSKRVIVHRTNKMVDCLKEKIK